MKSRKTIYFLLSGLSIATVFLLTLSLSSCGGDGGDDPGPADETFTAAEKAIADLITTTWKVSSVTVDGTDKSSLFTNFTINFSAGSNNGKPTLNGSYSCTNGGPIWGNGTSWTATDPNATAITRNDGIVVTLSDVSTSSFKMSLNWSKTTLGPGRSSSVKGQHIFTMTK